MKIFFLALYLFFFALPLYSMEDQRRAVLLEQRTKSDNKFLMFTAAALFLSQGAKAITECKDPFSKCTANNIVFGAQIAICTIALLKPFMSTLRFIQQIKQQ